MMRAFTGLIATLVLSGPALTGCGSTTGIDKLELAPAPTRSEDDATQDLYESARRLVAAFAETAATAVIRSDSQRLEYEVVTIRGLRSEAGGGSVLEHRWVRGFESGAQVTDSRRCAQVEDVVAGFARIEPPRPRLEDLNGQANPIYLEGPPNEPLTGGPFYIVRTQARYEGLSSARLEFTAKGTSATDLWFRHALTELAPCWRRIRRP